MSYSTWSGPSSTNDPWPPDLTVDEVVAACPSGPATGPRAKTMVRICNRDTDVRHGAVAVWIVDLLIGQVGVEAAVAVGESDPVSVRMFREIGREAAPTVAITAGRYVSVFGRSGAYDVETGDWVESVPPRWFETRVFNVRELVLACLERVSRARK